EKKPRRRRRRVGEWQVARPAVVEEVACELDGLGERCQTLAMGRHRESESLELGRGPPGAESRVDALAAVEERQVGERVQQRDGAAQADVRDERRDAE